MVFIFAEWQEAGSRVLRERVNLLKDEVMLQSLEDSLKIFVSGNRGIVGNRNLGRVRCFGGAFEIAAKRCSQSRFLMDFAAGIYYLRREDQGTPDLRPRCFFKQSKGRAEEQVFKEGDAIRMSRHHLRPR